MAIAKFICFSSQPRFQHDCKACKFLGILDNQDLYVCSAGGSKSYTRRFGHKDHENGSLPAEYASMLPEGDAYRLAIKLDKLKRPPAMYVAR